ncbi:hypothetical protein HID58_019349, partial [Brassica napus]
HNFTVFETRQFAYGFTEGYALSWYGDEISRYGFRSWDDLKVIVLNLFSTSVRQEKEQLEHPSLIDSLKEISHLLNRFKQRWKEKENAKKSQVEKTFESDEGKQAESDGGDDLILSRHHLRGTSFHFSTDRGFKFEQASWQIVIIMVAKSLKLNSSESDTDEEMTTMNEDDKRKVDTSTRNIQAKGSGHTDFRSVVERISSVSKKAVSNNSELCELLEVSKVIHHQPLGSQVKELASRVLGSSKNLTPCMLLLRRGLPQVNYDISLFLMTIKKLCLGEKKLHGEVTARERLRILYEKGYSCLKNIDKNGAESRKIYEEKAEVKLQLSKASKSCVHMVEKGSLKVAQKVEEQIRIFRVPLRGYIDTHGSSVRALKEWLNKNTMEEDDQTETEAPEIFKVCSEWLRETENVDDGIKVLNAAEEMELRFRGLWFKQIEKEKRRLRVGKLCKELEKQKAEKLHVLLKGEHAAPAGSAVERVKENLKVYLKVNRDINTEAEQEKIRNKIAELPKQKEKLQKMMSASGYEEKVHANIKEDNVMKLTKILQEFDFFEKGSKEKIQTENSETDVKKSTKDPKEKRKKKKDSKSDEVIFETSLIKHESLQKKLKQANVELAAKARELKHKLRERDKELAAVQSSSYLGERELDQISVEISISQKKVSVAVSGFGNKSQFLSQANEIVKRQEYEIHSLQRALKEKEDVFEMSIAAKRLERIQSLVQREKLERQRHMFQSESEGIRHEIEELEKLENLKVGLDDTPMAKMKLSKIERSWEKVSVLKQKVISRDDELELQNEVSIVIVVLLFAWAGQSRDSVYTVLCVDKDEILRVGFPGVSRGLKADPSKLERVEELKIGDWVRVKVPDSSISYGWSKPFSCSVIDIEKVVPFHDGQEIVECLSAHVTDRETFWKVSPGDAEMLSVRETSDWVCSYRSRGSRPSDDWFSVGKDNIPMEFICSHSLTKVVDSVSVLSCEVIKDDITSFSLLDSTDGFRNKDAISVASDFEFLLNGSKAVGKFNIEAVSRFSRIHGTFRD